MAGGRSPGQRHPGLTNLCNPTRFRGSAFPCGASLLGPSGVGLVFVPLSGRGTATTSLQSRLWQGGAEWLTRGHVPPEVGAAALTEGSPEEGAALPRRKGETQSSGNHGPAAWLLPEQFYYLKSEASGHRDLLILQRIK